VNRWGSGRTGSDAPSWRRSTQSTGEGKRGGQGEEDDVTIPVKLGQNLKGGAEKIKKIMNLEVNVVQKDPKEPISNAEEGEGVEGDSPGNRMIVDHQDGGGMKL
jgi:hypothetical protein